MLAQILEDKTEPKNSAKDGKPSSHRISSSPEMDLNKSGGFKSSEHSEQENEFDKAMTAFNNSKSVTVQYEIRILCAKEVSLKDGTQLMITWKRGEQAASTSVKLLKNNTVYFQQKFVMKTTLESNINGTGFEPKESRL